MSTHTPDIQIGPPARTVRHRSRHRVPSWALKATMAVSGALWVGFVAIHLFGNLKVFQGAAAFNGYAAWLREAFYPMLPKEFLLWGLRIALIVALAAHVLSAAVIWWRARLARGPHRARINGARSWGSWLMPVTGVVLLGFLIVHLLDLTLGLAPTATQAFAHPADGEAFAYENLVASFHRPLMAWFYIATMVLLAAHTAKGVTTMAADLGVMGHRLRATFTVVGGLLAVAIMVGNAAIPLLVQVGVIS
ncbi:succinate dehydrogenase / fumarate reductase cytochrome b subunit [Tessaracoccus bendigoensis DSM 12906]|uniref:Succinate dehydrogenase / fumarate reductase cytochrome b subunit n=1 Tax=Tessaracoccus bendigoensis DSM 12906 TaxID=1123357 RepID=A0A1M6B9Q4_9ACTN|nr:succinate dehydrogenase cytochrome b subunit [Tessaracoccus bendigoensis]SHI45442.1 succinate dehydrogenase / fumarate reductase cytochrome b subunit [Tessaracoccus bendigoensis DSM 12906]